jgi:hypothetical protein
MAAAKPKSNFQSLYLMFFILKLPKNKKEKK